MAHSLCFYAPSREHLKTFFEFHSSGALDTTDSISSGYLNWAHSQLSTDPASAAKAEFPVVLN